MGVPDPPDLLNRQRIALARKAAAHGEFRFRVIHVGAAVFHDTNGAGWRGTFSGV